MQNKREDACRRERRSHLEEAGYDDRGGSVPLFALAHCPFHPCLFRLRTPAETLCCFVSVTRCKVKSSTFCSSTFWPPTPSHKLGSGNITSMTRAPRLQYQLEWDTAATARREYSTLPNPVEIPHGDRKVPRACGDFIHRTGHRMTAQRRHSISLQPRTCLVRWMCHNFLRS